MDKINFIFSADYHFGIKKYGKENLQTGINTRIEEDFKQLDKIVDYTIKMRKDLFLVGGDVFNNRHPSDVVKKEFAKRLKKLIDNKIITIVLMGNHEGNIQGKAHCLSSEKVLINSKYLYIVDNIKEIEYRGINILCIPYFRKNINIENKIRSLKKKTIVLGHFTVSGARKDNYIFAGENYIQPEIFNNKNVIQVLLGHIHHHQQIGKIFYIGSINKINFNDEKDKKGFIEGEIIKGKCYMYFRELDSRKFLTINETWDKDIKRRISKIYVNDKIIRINLKVVGEKIIPTQAIKKYLRNKGSINITIKIDREREDVAKDKIYQNEFDPIKLLKHFLKNENKDIFKIGEEILNGIS